MIGILERNDRVEPLMTQVRGNMADDTSVFAGAMPTREGELSVEMHGMAPMPLANRRHRRVIRAPGG